ncbi:MAG: serine hydrolase domain-containing protein [Microcella pacifica]|uniref:Beta-lactamase family protein n=1 Tax=Microcella pacifica TaxID=2591847 RepID=A0A9E5ML21_9MICO|nr:serine hydrolase domain-containing protein [Microcella pacifica]NHF63361.1 beta-lactamase family protein [Microcella pacifica]
MCERLDRDPRVSELKLRVADRSGTLDYGWAAPGSRAKNAIASSTKTFAAVLVLRRIAAGDLTLEQPLVSILPRTDLEDLNRFGGRDHAEDITVRDVLAHTSGIPNYYAAKALDPRSDIAAVTAADPGWSFDETLEIARGMNAPFAPHSGRAQYSFTNYQLVGRLIETIAGCPLEVALRRELLDPLGVTDTALLTPSSLELFDAASPLLHGSQPYRGARRLASLGAEGALVSTTADTMRFLRAVFEGEILDPRMLSLATADRLPLFPRVTYGVGMMALSLPRLLTRLPRPGVLLGHAGMTGHVMFAEPVSGLYAVGTINQLAAPRLSFRLLVAALRAAHAS